MDCRIPCSLGLFGCRREGQAPGPAICVQNGPLCHLGLPARPDDPLPLCGFLPSWQRLMHSSLNRSEQTSDPVLTSSTASSEMRQAHSSFVNLPSTIYGAPFHPWPAAGRNRTISRFRIGCAEYGGPGQWSGRAKLDRSAREVFADSACSWQLWASSVPLSLAWLRAGPMIPASNR